MLLALLLSGCQSQASAPQKGLTAGQIAVLEQQGFVQGDDGWELGLSSKVLFGNNEDRITEASRVTVARLGNSLLGVDIRRLRLEGHTDSYGTPEYNQRLSLRRAQAVARVLVSTGMRSEDLQVLGRGMEEPVGSNNSAAGRQENRRVSIIVPAE